MKSNDGRPEEQLGEFSHEAREAWNLIPERARQALLSNVCCGNCGRVTTIVAFRATIERGSLTLIGSCKNCGSEVSRVIEQPGPTKLFTIGFVGRSAEQFFEPLRDAGVKLVVDIRLNNVSQLAGFTKRGDLPYFLQKICGIGYVHVPELAPTKEIMDSYKSGAMDWPTFEAQFTELMRERGQLGPDSVIPKLARRGPVALLCSEADALRCHRSLVAEQARRAVPGLVVVHL